MLSDDLFIWRTCLFLKHNLLIIIFCNCIKWRIKVFSIIFSSVSIILIMLMNQNVDRYGQLKFYIWEIRKKYWFYKMLPYLKLH